METKEKVKLMNGEDKEITIKFIGSRTADIILDKHLKLNGINKTDEGQYMDLKGTSLFKIKQEFLDKGLAGFDYDDLAEGEATRIYQKYYQKIMNDAMNFMGGNPQS